MGGRIAQPTKQDAELLLKIWDRFPLEAFSWVRWEMREGTYDELKQLYPPTSEAGMRLSRVLGTYEMMGVLLSQNLLNRDLVHDTVPPISMVWSKLRPVVEGTRKELGNPAFYENAEWFKEDEENWSETVWKPGQAWKR